MSDLCRYKICYNLLLVIFCLVILANCTTQKELEPTSDVPIQSSTEVVIIQPTVTLGSEITNTQMPTPVSTETAAMVHATATFTPVAATPTITPIATLSVLEEGEFLRMLMANNGNCDLPCWWNITPGITEDQAARDMFASQGIDDWIASFDGTYRIMSLGYPYADSPYYSSDVLMQLWVEDNVIQFIRVEGSRRQDEERHLFTRDWQQYKLSSILKSFGIPTYVTLTPEISADAGPSYYQLRLSYDSLGIEVSYIVAPEVSNGGKEQICSDFEHTNYIYLVLYPPERVTDVPVNIIPNHLDDYISWEAMTGMNLENFYETFENANESVCVEIDTR